MCVGERDRAGPVWWWWWWWCPPFSGRPLQATATSSTSVILSELLASPAGTGLRKRPFLPVSGTSGSLFFLRSATLPEVVWAPAHGWEGGGDLEVIRAPARAWVGGGAFSCRPLTSEGRGLFSSTTRSRWYSILLVGGRGARW